MEPTSNGAADQPSDRSASIIDTDRETTVMAKYHFTDEEKSEIALESALATQEMQQLSDELKAIKSDYKSRLEERQRTINDGSRKITNGWEMRPFRCRLWLNFEEGRREYVCLETGEILKTAPLTAEDHQLSLELAEQAEAGIIDPSMEEAAP